MSKVKKMDFKKVSVNIPMPLYEDLEYYSSYHGMSIGECIREALRIWIVQRAKELKDTDKIKLQLKRMSREGGVVDAR